MGAKSLPAFIGDVGEQTFFGDGDAKARGRSGGLMEQGDALFEGSSVVGLMRVDSWYYAKDDVDGGGGSLD